MKIVKQTLLIAQGLGAVEEPEYIAVKLPVIGISTANENAFCAANLSSDRVELLVLLPLPRFELPRRLRMRAHLWIILTRY